MLFSWKGGIRLIDEDVSRRTIAVSIKATKLTGRVLAQACLAVGRKIKKTYRARQTPHGKQTVRQLMGHGAATNSIEVESPKDFDRVARRWNREVGQIGQNYLRSLFAVGFQGLLILVCVAIYAVLIQGIATGGDPIGAIWGTVGYTVLLCFMLFKTGTIARSIFSAH